MMVLSVIIKARNEAPNIARAIESALAACKPHGGEVILADSCSTDETVAVARRYPVTIVQLEHAEDACCGIGPEMGFRQARGQYIYILDGDMELDAAFVDKALLLLREQSDLAGVGGYIREMRPASNLIFKRRTERQESRRITSPRDTECLSGGGLYRRTALEQVQYMSDRNLHSYEEYELGCRLRSAGWRLTELPDHAADHFSYDLPTNRLLLHRLRSGSMLGQGELLRAALDRGYIGKVFGEVRAIRISFALLAYWFVVALAAIVTGRPFTSIVLGVGLALAAALAIGLKHRNVVSGFNSVVTWHLCLGGMIAGFLRHRRPPAGDVATVVLHRAPAPVPTSTVATSASI